MRLSYRLPLLTLFLLAVVTLSGCVTTTRDMYMSETNKALIHNPNDETRAVFEKYLGENWKYVIYQSIHYANNTNTDFHHPRPGRAKYTTPHSSSDKTILIFRQFWTPEQKPPLYRYIFFSLDKKLPAGDLIKAHQGKYIFSDYNLPASIPDKLTDGLLVTDWHLCLICFGSTTDDLTKLSLYDVTAIENSSISSQSAWLYNIAEEKAIRGDGKKFYQRYGKVPVVAGRDATKKHSEYTSVKLDLSSQISQDNQNRKAYKDFYTREHHPLTYESWAKQKHGCEAKSPRYNGSTPDESIKILNNFLNCNNNAVNSYDIAPYVAAYPEMKKKEETLRGSIKGKLDSDDIKIVRSPEDMMSAVSTEMKKAIRGIEDLYETKQDEMERSRIQAHNDAIANQQFQDAINTIDKMHSDTLNQALIDNQRMVDQAWAQRKAQEAATVKQMKQIQHKQREAERQIEQIQQAQGKRRDAQSEAEVNTDKASSPEPKQLAINSAKSHNEQVKTLESALKKANQIVDSARDYKMSGTTGAYYAYDIAVDLAETNLMNKAAKFCDSSMKAQISWGESSCKKSEHTDTYTCTVDGLVNCWEQPCETNYCTEK